MISYLFHVYNSLFILTYSTFRTNDISYFQYSLTSTDEWRKIDFSLLIISTQNQNSKCPTNNSCCFRTIFLFMAKRRATTRVFTLYLNFVVWKEGYALYLLLSSRVYDCVQEREN